MGLDCIPLILICLLDSNYFLMRHNANVALDEIGIVALPQLILTNRNPQSIEVSVRVRRTLNRYSSVMVKCICGDKVPYIDSIPEEGIEGICSGPERAGVIDHYTRLARSEWFTERLLEERKICGADDKWPEYRLAARLLFEDLRDNQVDDRKLIKGVKLLQIRCEDYLKNNNNWSQDIQK